MLCLVSVFACDWPFLLRVPPYIQLILSDAIAFTAYTSLLIVRACQAREPLGIQYTCCDAAKLGQWLKADVVFAAYLLNYASSYEELVHFVRAIYVTLPEGGIFVTMQNSPNDVVCHHPELKKYGVTKTCEQPGVEGATIKWTFFDGDQELCTVDNYYLSAQTHERAFREVGFRCVGFVNPNVSPTGLQLAESGYYDDFIDAAPIQGIFALK